MITFQAQDRMHFVISHSFFFGIHWQRRRKPGTWTSFRKTTGWSGVFCSILRHPLHRSFVNWTVRTWRKCSGEEELVLYLVLHWVQNGFIVCSTYAAMVLRQQQLGFSYEDKTPLPPETAKCSTQNILDVYYAKHDLEKSPLTIGISPYQ